MAETGAQKLVIAISSRALFNLDDAHRIFEQEGLDAYSDYQVEKEDETLEPGQAFPMVKKLLALNSQLPASLGIEVILLSRNSADTGLRVFNSIEHHGLSITRAAFCGGEPPWRYIEAFGCQLFLSAEGGDVRVALYNGVAAATLVSNATAATEDDLLRFAFERASATPAASRAFSLARRAERAARASLFSHSYARSSSRAVSIVGS